MTTAEILGSRIQKIRLAKKITQEELAYKIDKSAHYISAIERGVRSPRLTTIIKIMETLQVTPNELFCDFINLDDPMSNVLGCISAMEDKDKAFVSNFVEKFYTYISKKL